ncbi:MAG: type III pantothenate kinase [Spirochaetes bacterium]|nr:type III pantothenate kinase [Spirochaetota bacterium]MBL7006962.1 type III pantothenate kinase [Spirochaetia bacterium]
MILCIDAGNSQIYCGLYRDSQIVLRFRKVSDQASSSDEIGLFLRGAIRENGFDPDAVKHIAYCSVVPDMNHAVVNSCKHYFGIDPFVLKAGTRTGLKIRYKNPLAVGADRIANAIGAIHRYPGKNLLIADFGTATTFDVITAAKEYLGGAIMSGMRLGMQALEEHTAKLPKVEILQPDRVCGQSTEESIQSGLYYGNLGAVRELVTRLTEENFTKGQEVKVLATGGFSTLFRDAGVFDEVIPDLVLEGIYQALKMNSMNPAAL